MHSVFSKNLFFVKEHRGIFKASNSYDVFDPSNHELLIECREPNLGFFTKLFRFTDYKTATPFEVVLSANGKKILTVKRGISIFLSKVKVLDENDQLIGIFKQKFFSIGGKFDLLDEYEQPLCTLKGSWTGWDFSFEKDGVRLARVTKKWAGIGKEMFTSADNYILAVEEQVPADSHVRQLVMAAVMCIDMVLKER